MIETIVQGGELICGEKFDANFLYHWFDVLKIRGY